MHNYGKWRCTISLPHMSGSYIQNNNSSF